MTSCKSCIYQSRLCGVEVCKAKEHKAGEAMTRCELFRADVLDAYEQTDATSGPVDVEGMK